jgi:hypothetical protein
MITPSADKRSVSTDALETLGTIHVRQEYRDAIHLAVEPVIAGQPLKAGDHIYLHEDKAFKVPKNSPSALGIVDPFLPSQVKEGQSFWLVVYPRKITSLRHVWSHPSFPETAAEVEPVALQRKIPETLEESQERVVAIKTELYTLEQEWVKAKQAAYNWIDNYRDRLGIEASTEELIGYGESNLDGKYGEYLVEGGTLEGECVAEEFWDHLAIYLNREIPDDDRNNFFSCRC